MPRLIRPGVSRVGLLPQFVGLRRFLQFSGRLQVVASFDGIPLRFAHLLPEAVCLACVVGPSPDFIEISVGNCHGGVGQGEIRVEFDCPLVEGQRGCFPFRYRVLCPRLYAFSASRDGVVASSTGVAYFCTELSDSPSLRRKLVAAVSSALSTASLSACACAPPARPPWCSRSPLGR